MSVCPNKRAGSWQCGAACSTQSPPQIRSQASCRHRKSVVPGRRQLIRQDREGLAGWLTDSPPHPDAGAPVIVPLTNSPAMADDGVVMANRTAPRQQFQGDHPGSVLSFASGSAIKRITAGVKARRRPFSAKVSICWPGLHPPAKSISNEKKNTALPCRPLAPHSEHWPH